MSKFNGKWKDQNDDIITVEVTERILTVNYNNERGSFTGYEIPLYLPVVGIDFHDKK